MFLYSGIMFALAACLLFFYYRSGRFNTTYAELHDEIDRANNSQDNSYEKIIRLDSGKWYSNKWEMYHSLSFEPDNYIVIDNHVDTIFHYKYTLNKDTLWLWVNEKKSIPNKIKLHDNNELVFEDFLNEKKEFRYVRKGNMQK